jgi:hypothetical protein
MSWESERDLDPGRPTSPAPPLAPLLAGLVLGLVAMAGTPFVYYWLFMPLFPLALAAVFVLLGIKFTGLRHVAEGLLAATLFGVVFVLVAFAGLGNVLPR